MEHEINLFLLLDCMYWLIHIQPEEEVCKCVNVNEPDVQLNYKFPD